MIMAVRGASSSFFLNEPLAHPSAERANPNGPVGRHLKLKHFKKWLKILNSQHRQVQAEVPLDVLSLSVQ